MVLVGGYFLYGSYVERVFGPDKTRKTPALTMADGVDFIPPVSYTHLDVYKRQLYTSSSGTALS